MGRHPPHVPSHDFLKASPQPQAGLGVGEGRPEGGLGTSVSQGCRETGPGRAMDDASSVEGGNTEASFGNCFLVYSMKNV